MNALKKLSISMALFVSLGALTTGSTAAELKAGDPAPDFELKGSDGKTYKLSEFKGQKPVVVAWFPRAFTPGCTAECKSLKENGADLKKLNVAYFTASVDEAAKNADFAKSLELDYPILSDPTQETAKAYGVYNAERKIANRWTFYIDKAGKIAHVDKSVKTGSHGADVAAKLKVLGLAENQ